MKQPKFNIFQVVCLLIVLLSTIRCSQSQFKAKSISVEIQIISDHIDTSNLRQTISNRLLSLGATCTFLSIDSSIIKLEIEGLNDTIGLSELITSKGNFRIEEAIDHTITLNYLNKLNERLKQAGFFESTEFQKALGPDTIFMNQDLFTKIILPDYRGGNSIYKVGQVYNNDIAIVTKCLSQYPEILPKGVNIVWMQGSLVGIKSSFKPLVSRDMLENFTPKKGDLVTYVNFNFKQAHRKYWHNITLSNQNKGLAVIMDEEVLTIPILSNTVRNGYSTINTDFSLKRAIIITAILNHKVISQNLQVEKMTLVNK